MPIGLDGSQRDVSLLKKNGHIKDDILLDCLDVNKE